MYQDTYKKTLNATQEFSAVNTEKKNAILDSIAKLLLKNKEEIILANAKDMERARKNGRNNAFLDRLLLTEKRIEGMAEGLQAVIKLTDPVGEMVDNYPLPNGLMVEKVRVPLGVIGIIFEARPNVSVDAAALCIKSGNGVVLRGSRDSSYSVEYLVSLIKKAIKDTGFDENLVALIDHPDRDHTINMLKQDKYIDVVIPRGGEGLKKVVLENATMPVIASAGGNCHIYVAKSAKEQMAIDVVLNAKLSRPSTCNAVETLLIDTKVDKSMVVAILKALEDKGVELRGDEKINSLYPVKIIDDEEYYTEYGDLIIKIKFVDGVKEAVKHINHYGTKHSEAIITQDNAEGEIFAREVDGAVVYINASTRFTDGFELGLGAEMGISTQKLHVRGPIGLKELTSTKYIVRGTGSIR